MKFEGVPFSSVDFSGDSVSVFDGSLRRNERFGTILGVVLLSRLDSARSPESGDKDGCCFFNFSPGTKARSKDRLRAAGLSLDSTPSPSSSPAEVSNFFEDDLFIRNLNIAFIAPAGRCSSSRSSSSLLGSVATAGAAMLNAPYRASSVGGVGSGLGSGSGSGDGGGVSSLGGNEVLIVANAGLRSGMGPISFKSSGGNLEFSGISNGFGISTSFCSVNVGKHSANSCCAAAKRNAELVFAEDDSNTDNASSGVIPNRIRDNGPSQLAW